MLGLKMKLGLNYFQLHANHQKVLFNHHCPLPMLSRPRSMLGKRTQAESPNADNDLPASGLLK